MRPLIPFISYIRTELSDIASHPLRLSSFDRVKVVLYPMMTLYAFPVFSNNLLVRDTHSNSCLPSSIFSISASPFLILTGLAMTFGDSFMMVDCMSVPYVAV